jgi:ribosomal protein S18 acetylase RimI-like enzyme
MKSQITVKRATLEDWKNYKEIRLDALQKNPESFGRAYEEEKNRSENEWKSKLEDKNRTTLLVLDGKKAVGILGIIFESSARVAHIADIISVYLKEEYRGKGIASQLMEEAIKVIKSRKITKKVKLNVTTNQLPAVNLYKKFGFRIVGELKNEMNVNGKYYNSYVMELLLK